MLLFLVLAINSNQFQILQSYSSRLFLCTLAIVLSPCVVRVLQCKTMFCPHWRQSYWTSVQNWWEIVKEWWSVELLSRDVRICEPKHAYRLAPWPFPFCFWFVFDMIHRSGQWATVIKVCPRAICLLWVKNFWPCTSRTDSSLLEIYKKIWRYPDVPIPPGTDAAKSSIGGGRVPY